MIVLIAVFVVVQPTEGFGWEEATDAVTHQRTFLLNKLFTLSSFFLINYIIVNPVVLKIN